MFQVAKPLIISSLLLLVGGCSVNGVFCRVYKNLGNPTQYEFNSSQPKVEGAINDLNGKFIIPHVLKLNKTQDGLIRMIVFPCYSTDYWSGSQEADVDWPEAGKIGQIAAKFNVNILPLGQKTLVVVKIDEFVQETRRSYVVFPDFHKTGIMKNVKSDTYFEYVLLTTIGKRLGETNMPPLKSAVVSW